MNATPGVLNSTAPPAQNSNGTMYSQQISTATPGLILALLDQSGSMNEPYLGAQTKALFAARALNRCIQETIDICTPDGVTTKPRCMFGVVGYGGAKAEVLKASSGWITELKAKSLRNEVIRRDDIDVNGNPTEAEEELAVWVEPTARGVTPMAAAFAEAAELIALFVEENSSSFPPVVINISDGEPTDAEGRIDLGGAERAARRVLDAGTTDGKVLLLNAHIAASGPQEILLPSVEPADQYARFLFSISSQLPEVMAKRARAVGFPAKPGSRGCILNGRAETLMKLLNFGSPVQR